MANRYIEKYVQCVRMDGLKTNKPASFGSTVTITGAVTATGGVSGGAVSATTLTSSSTTTLKYPILLGTVTDYDAQAAVLTVAGIAGGTVTQNSKTGASTLTTPTGAQLTTAFGDVAGTTLDVFFHNRGNQTSTVTAGASGVTIKGATVAITTDKTAHLRFVNMSAGTWNCYVIASA